ncbi:zinc ribbon domain-containing protein [Salarchaeum japonicum]|uniref:Zinc ribbon domain-containing protein n=1 Tax=Salarchaeum japonicum TaxID=555573 RepID=A0AAV3T0K1_9EURY|nr:zinc ribbon domain-containing protein [Salarchaeum japonicum]
MALNRRGILAAALSFVYPGLGQLYRRAWIRAFAWVTLAVAIAYLLTPTELLTAFEEQGLAVFETATIPMELTIALLVIRVLSAADAYFLAVAQAADRDAALADAVPTPGSADAEPGADAAASEDDAATCPNCGREIDEELDFCPWCTYEFENE